MTIPEAGPTWPSERFTDGKIPDHDQAKELARRVRDSFGANGKTLELDAVLKFLDITLQCRTLIKKASELLPIPDCTDGPFRLLINPEPAPGYLNDLEDAQTGSAVSLQHQFCQALQLGHTFFYQWTPPVHCQPPGNPKCGPTRHIDRSRSCLEVQGAAERESEFCRYFAYWLLLPDYQSDDDLGMQECLKLLIDVERLD